MLKQLKKPFLALALLMALPLTTLAETDPSPVSFSAEEERTEKLGTWLNGNVKIIIDANTKIFADTVLVKYNEAHQPIQFIIFGKGKIGDGEHYLRVKNAEYNVQRRDFTANKVNK